MFACYCLGAKADQAVTFSQEFVVYMIQSDTMDATVTALLVELC